MKIKYKNILKLLVCVIALTSIIFGVNYYLNYKNSNAYKEKILSESYKKLAPNDDAIDGTDNVKFSAFFLRDTDNDGNAEKIYGTVNEIGKGDILYFDINVLAEGTLKNGKVTINGKNFYLQSKLPYDSVLKENYFSNNLKEIEFNDISNGTQKLIETTVRSGDYTYDTKKHDAIDNDTKNYSREDNVIVFTGTYYPEEGDPIELRKEIPLTVDWYGDVKTTINDTTVLNNTIAYNLDNLITGDKVEFVFSITTTENENQLILRQNHVEVEIPDFENYPANNVECLSSNVVCNYDSDNKVLSIDRTSTEDEFGNVVSALASTNTYEIKVEYPKEAYTENYSSGEQVTLRFPVRETYSGYNNPNAPFENPKISNEASSIVTVIYASYDPSSSGNYYDDSFDVSIGTFNIHPYPRYFISKEKVINLYNGSEPSDDEYLVKWNYSRGNLEDDRTIVLKESDTDIIDTSNTHISIKDHSSFAGIYFYGLYTDEFEEIKIYDDDTNELIEDITESNYRSYNNIFNMFNPQPEKRYYYDSPVKHIRVEIIGASPESDFDIRHIKTLDDSYIYDTYTEDEFETFAEINTKLVVTKGTYSNNKTAIAKYEAPYSNATIEVKPDILSTQETTNVDLIINAENYKDSNEVAWVDGIFLIKLPDEFLITDIKSVTSDTVSNKVQSYEYIENDNGKFIKIMMSNRTPSAYKITVNADITLNQKISTISKNVELYSYNDNPTFYYRKVNDIYDINGNLNTLDSVNYNDTEISLVAPNLLVTMDTITEYDENRNDEIVIGPQLAEVDNFNDSATVNVELLNNYDNDVKNIVVLGKIPTIGNKYDILNQDLGSQFDSTLLGNLVLSDAIKDRVTIYYSTEINPTNDLTDPTNNWVVSTNVSDFSNIKSYLIDFNDVVLSNGDDYIISYSIELPTNTGLGDKSFATHSIYYSIVTPNGLYNTSTEPIKVGIVKTKKFTLTFSKYQKDKIKLIPGATYKVSEITYDENNEEVEGKTSTGTTNNIGVFEISNLYVDTIYKISEMKAPNNYVISSDPIYITSQMNNDGTITVTKIQGDTRDEITISDNGTSNPKVLVSQNDEVLAKVKVVKEDYSTGTKLDKVNFRLSSTSYSKRGSTNTNGEIEFTDTPLNEELTLEETKSKEGYYLVDPIKFTINDDNGNYTISVNGEYDITTSIEEIDSIPYVTVVVKDQKIPTYQLNVKKVKKTTTVAATPNENTQGTDEIEYEYIEGAVLGLYKDNKLLGTFETDANGFISINGLYLYDENHLDEDGIYVLKEIVVPDGFVKFKDITFKARLDNGNLEFVELLSEGQKPKKFTANENSIEIIVEDPPTFLLTKYDGETNELLENAKFVIFKKEGSTFVPAVDSNGEIVGEHETINGVDYYVVSTNQNGEVTLNLPEGLYKIIEVQGSDDKYDISDKIYYFGINQSVETKTSEGVEPIAKLNELNTDNVNKVDDGYLIYTDINQLSIDGVTIDASHYANSALIKIDDDLHLVDYKEFKSNRNWSSTSYAKSIELSDGNYVFTNLIQDYIEVDDTRVNVEGSSSASGTSIVKAGGDLTIHDIATIPCYVQNIYAEDNGFVLIAYYTGTIEIAGQTFVNTSTSTNKYVKIVFDNNCDIVSVEETELPIYDYRIETNDGGHIYAGDYSRRIVIGGETVTPNTTKGSGYTSIFLYKENADGSIEYIVTYKGYYNDLIYDCIYTEGDKIILYARLTQNARIGDVYVGSTSNFYKITLDASTGDLVTYEPLTINYYTKAEALSDGGYAEMIQTKNPINIGGTTYNSDSKNAVFLDRYDADGNLLYVIEGRDSGYDGYPDIAEAEDGSVYYLSNYLELNGKTVSSDYDYYVLTKVNRDGNIEYNTILYDRGVVIDGDIILGNEWNRAIYKLSDVNVTDPSSDVFDVLDYTYNGYNIPYMEKNGNYLYAIVNDRYNNTYFRKYDGANNLVDEKKYTFGMKDSTAIIVGDEIKYVGFVTKWGSAMTPSTSTGSATATAEGTTCETDYCLLIATYDLDMNFISQEIYDASYDNGKTTDCSNIKMGTVNPDGSFILFYDNPNIGITINDRYYEAGDNNTVLLFYDNNNRLKKVTVYDKRVKSITQTSDNTYLIYSVQNEPEKINVFEEYDYNNNLVSHKEKTYSELYIPEFSYCGYDYQKSGYVIKTNKGDYIIVGYPDDEFNYIGPYPVHSHGYSSYEIPFLIKLDKDLNVTLADTFDGYNGDVRTEIEIPRIISTNNSLVMAIYLSPPGNSETYDHGLYFGDKLLDDHTSRRTVFMNLILDDSFNDTSSLNIENLRKVYRITTDVEEVNGVKGGNITGEDEAPYEVVLYGDDSTNEIKMVPEQDYKIIKITVNDEQIDFVANDDGTYTLPQFENVTENKHVVVTYALTNSILTLNKRDADTNEIIETKGVKFDVERIVEETAPEIGPMVADSDYYVGSLDKTVNYNSYMGSLTNNETYYFVQNGTTYTPNNSGLKKRCKAASYIKIDLTDLTGYYAVNINARVSSEKYYGYGYAFITDNTELPSQYTQPNRFIYISGNVADADYVSPILEGGNTYYLHIAYNKDSTRLVGDDIFTINSIDLYKANETMHGFDKVGDKYVSTNYEDESIASSYFIVDLTDKEFDYVLTLNAETNGYWDNVAFAHATESIDRVDYEERKNRFLYLEGFMEAKDYKTLLKAGKKYYIHLGYYIDDKDDYYEDKFTINNISIAINKNSVYNETIETDSNGIASAKLDFGRYRITELEAPEGYFLNTEPMEIDFNNNSGSTHEFNFSDNKIHKIIVHHLFKDNDGTYTDIKLADDEEYEGKLNDPYETFPKVDITNFVLEKVNDEYVLPDNRIGTYEDEVIHINYYYEQGTVPLIVKHLIEGTTTGVTLKDGTPKEDTETYGRTGDPYQTSPVSNEELSDDYELSITPTNANGTYSDTETVVTYYYKPIERNVTLIKTNEDESETLAGIKFEIDGEEYTTNSEGKINIKLNSGDHIYKEIETLPNYRLDTEEHTLTVTRDMVDNYELKVKNELKKGKVIVHHYILNTTEKLPLINGEDKDDDITEDFVGNIYATSPVDSSLTNYQLVSADVDNKQGLYIDGTIEVTYYYEVPQTTYKVEYYYDYVKDETATEEDTSYEGKKIDEYIDKIKDGYIFKETENFPLIVSNNVDNNIIKVYYVSAYTITTSVTPHTEKYFDGSTSEVKGGTISGEGDTPYETVGYLDDSTKEIVITPDSGYEISSIKVNGTPLDISTYVDEYGVVSLSSSNGFFTSMDENKNVVVEFRKKSKVTVKFKEASTGTELDTKEELEGYQDEAYSTQRRNIQNYQAIMVETTEGTMSGVTVNGYNSYDDSIDHVFTADDIEITYWYTKIPESTVIVKHIEIDDAGNQTLLEEETYDDYVGTPIDTSRKTYTDTTTGRNYYSVNGGVCDVCIDKDTDSYQATVTENEVVEVKYFYQRSYYVKTKNNTEDGGTISGDGLDKYEEIVRNGNNTLPIEITPNSGYRVKSVKVNGSIINITNLEDSNHKVTIPANYFTSVTEDKLVEVEFEKIPAKVIVKYVDIDTDEEIITKKEIDGYVNDPYDESRVPIDNYITAGTEPTGYGTMTEETTEIIYYYKRQFKITTDVVEHLESLRDEIIIPGSNINERQISVKGGTISGEDETPYETVPRGEDSTKTINIKADDGYIIKSITINGVATTITNNKEMTLPLFTDMFEDKVVLVRFELEKANLTVQYIDKDTGEIIETEVKIGNIDDKYSTSKKDYDDYEYVESSDNVKGTLTEDTIVKYYYKKKPVPINPIDGIINPITGDNILFYISLMITSLFVLIYFIRKKNHSQKA